MFNRIKEFLKEVNIEVRKVIYPSKDELKGSVLVVIVAVVMVSIFLGVVDLGLSKVVEKLLR